MDILTRWACVLGCLGFVAGCAPQAGDAPTAATVEATPAIFNAAGAPTVEFSVPDMMCTESCAPKAKEILARQPGAREVVVDFESKTATVAVDEEAFDEQQALMALVDRFDNAVLKSATDGNPQAEAIQ